MTKQRQDENLTSKVALIYINTTEDFGYWVAPPYIVGLSEIWETNSPEPEQAWVFTVYVRHLRDILQYFDTIEKAREAFNEIWQQLNTFHIDSMREETND